jgi:tetratricopeptide (TPR) repeat protein
MRIAVAVILVAATAGHAEAGDAKKAKALNAKGMKLYQKKKYEAAQKMFADAVAADPDMVIPHYNLASVAAIQDDVAAVVEQLTWLGASTDPAAKARLVKAKSDPDFQAVAGEPKVREMLGLPALDHLDASLLLEYGGVWSGIDMGCASAWEEYRFAKDGSYKERSYCGDDGEVHKSKGKWAVADGKLMLNGEASEYAFAPCSALLGDDSESDAICLNSSMIVLSHGAH